MGTIVLPRMETNMRYHIKQPGRQESLEQHDNPYDAQRAVLILNAQEIKHGREPIYYVDPPTEVSADWNLHLPDWAVEALEKNNA